MGGALAPVVLRSPPEAEVDTDGIEQGNGPINFWKKNESPQGERGNPALMRRAFAGLSAAKICRENKQK
ncbi:MAG: hypothetical protein COB78_13530 [Hyphomicrobiales bacterium]|nr:MAG: hypothetical protein COB78_13530 [Hyphomicrobiales bacterium]